jgi:hypothetical protein
MSAVQMPSCGMINVAGVVKTGIFVQAVLRFFFSNAR